MQLQIFIQANITVGKKLKTCQERPHLLSGCFIKVCYKMTTCPRQPLLSGPKSGHPIQVLLYASSFCEFVETMWENVFLHRRHLKCLQKSIDLLVLKLSAFCNFHCQPVDKDRR